jgi:hypothetical protein
LYPDSVDTFQQKPSLLVHAQKLVRLQIHHLPPLTTFLQEELLALQWLNPTCMLTLVLEFLQK